MQGGIALSPSKKAKYVSYNTKINTIISQQMVFFQARNALKTVFGWSFAPDPIGGAYDSPPDLLVGWGGGHPLPIPSSSPGKLQQQHTAKPQSTCLVELVINHNAE